MKTGLSARTGGALGLGVGLGLQPSGDRIEIGELLGDVVAIKGRSTIAHRPAP